MRFVSRDFLNDMLDEYYKQLEKVCFFCHKSNYCFCQRSYFFEEELRNRKFRCFGLENNLFEKKSEYCYFASSFN